MSEFRGYKNVDDFLKDTNPVEYDFKYQLGQKLSGIRNIETRTLAEDMITTENAIWRILKYKCYNKPNIRFDCDGNKNCDLSLEIYKKLWGNFDKKVYGPDTINSFISSYKKSKSDLNGRDDEMFRNFAVLTHTIGNFTLVPRMEDKFEKGFNSYRGFKYGDYWDISLQHLLKDGFNKDKDKFQKYIDTFFLWDYVDEKYNPLSLFMNNEEFKARKSCDINSVPRVNYINFLDNVEYAIKRRGKFIVYMLCNIEKYDDFKSKTSVEKVEKYNAVINNFDDWFHNYRKSNSHL